MWSAGSTSSGGSVEVGQRVAEPPLDLCAHALRAAASSTMNFMRALTRDTR